MLLRHYIIILVCVVLWVEAPNPMIRRHGDSSPGASSTDIHGGVPMGEPDSLCDDAEIMLDIDWDNSTDYEYTCHTQIGETGISTIHTKVECIPHDEIPEPLHYCMDENITYTDIPPRAGPHRPLWPVYGEYIYIPPQRWLHALEHGAVVMLYHPCVDKETVNQLRFIVTSCIRKHIITPYQQLPLDTPLAVLTYGCKLMISGQDPFNALSQIIDFIKATALRTDESGVTSDGDYDRGLVKKANIVSDLQDSQLCPLMDGKIAEDMYLPYQGAFDNYVDQR